MFSAYGMGSHIVYICCIEFQTFILMNCSIFNILTNVFSELTVNVNNMGSRTVSTEHIMSLLIYFQQDATLHS